MQTVKFLGFVLNNGLWSLSNSDSGHPGPEGLITKKKLRDFLGTIGYYWL